jgi:sulfatase maturation enzyme AslB (radical SAM superfamily)
MLERYVIYTTNNCNCNCHYCYLDDKESQFTWEDIKILLDNIVKYNKKFTLEFLGGEPVLRWDLIVKIYEYLEYMPDVNVPEYGITTNGTILNDNIISYLKNNKKLHWAVSLDGHKTANQLRTFKDGKNTLDVVMNNIKKLQENNINFSIHMVTHPYNVAMISDSVDFFYQKGIRNIDVGIIEKTIKIDGNFCDKYLSEMIMISHRMKNYLYPDLRFGPFNYLKPKNDVRTYIKDETGKTIAESYGRSPGDITDDNIYHNTKCATKTEIGIMIQELRQKVYEMHQEPIKWEI